MTKSERPRTRSRLVCRATVAMALALVAAFSSPSAMWLTARTRTPAATAPQMCTTEKPEAPTPSGVKEGSGFSLHLRKPQGNPEEYVARVLMMVCSVSAAEAASLAMKAGGVHVGTWERAIAEHACEGLTAKGVMADLIPAYIHRGEALVAVKADGVALYRASPELQADREVVLAAVQQNGWVLEYASPELQADREVVLAAVQQNGWVLKYASEELRIDREVALAAVQQNGRVLEYALRGLPQADHELMAVAAAHRKETEAVSDRHDHQLLPFAVVY